MKTRRISVILILIVLIFLINGCNTNNAIYTEPKHDTPVAPENSNSTYEVSNNNPEDSTNSTQTVVESIFGNCVNGGYAVSSDGYTYYVNGLDVGETSDNQLYRTNSDWTEKTEITDDKPKYIYIVGDWIFYVNTSEKTTASRGQLYKIKVDGTQRTKLCDYECTYLVADEDWIYYASVSAENTDPYRIKTDGTMESQIT